MTRIVEKEIRSISTSAVGTSQTNTTLYTAAERSTIVRIVGSIMFAKGGSASSGSTQVVIQRVAEGQTAQTLDLTTGNELVDDASLILWHGAVRPPAGADADWAHNFHIDVRGMRKMRVGDTIVISYLSTAADMLDAAGSITVFRKLA